MMAQSERQCQWTRLTRSGTSRKKGGKVSAEKIATGSSRREFGRLTMSYDDSRRSLYRNSAQFARKFPGFRTHGSSVLLREMSRHGRDPHSDPCSSPWETIFEVKVWRTKRAGPPGERGGELKARARGGVIKGGC